MEQKTFNGVTGVLFLLIALLHGLRAVYGWPAAVNGWAVPAGVSWAALIIAGYLAFSAYNLMGRQR